MYNKVTFKEFAQIFKDNIIKRSRTAKGTSETLVSEKKKKLLLSGKELRKQVEENTEKLIEDVWNSAQLLQGTPEGIQMRMESWNRIINHNLRSPDTYLEEYEKLCKEAKEVSKITGIFYSLNPEYRTWDVNYTAFRIPLLELDFAMDNFSHKLSSRLYKMCLSPSTRTLHKETQLLAYADHMIDGVIHPWIDGCGRNATAMVMWLSIIFPEFKLPVFRERNEHYASILDIEAHTRYFELCLE